jgi:signal transduction histidine kinase
MTTESLTAAPATLDLAFESLFGVLPVGILVAQGDLGITYRNPAARALAGTARSLADLIGLAGSDGPSRLHLPTLQRALESGETVYREGIRYENGSEEPHLTNWTLAPIRHGARQYTLVIIEDVTASNTLQSRLEQSERHAAVGKLAARVAHELNNPLDGILRYVNLADRLLGEGGNPKISEYLGQCRTGLKRMARIIAELLEFSRSGDALTEEMSINSIVEDAIRAMHEPADRNHVTISAAFRNEPMPAMRGGRLFQICCNLIKNAIDAMPDGGRLMITTAVAGPEVILQFEDTGCGLPADTSRLFEPFYTTKAPGKGTGLGLAICKEYVASFGGTIEARQGRERGAAFIVRFPLAGTVATPVPTDKS